MCFCLLVRSLSFKVRIGGGSGCETADSGEDVVVEYQAQGSSSFIQLTKLAYNGNVNLVPSYKLRLSETFVH